MTVNSPGRVLIVEDNAELLAVLEELLVRQGYQVLKAQNGVQALVHLTGAASDLPDVMVLDVGLPLQNGVTVLDFVRNAVRSNLPVIILTASADPDQEAELRKLGVSGYLRKPASAERILAAISEALAPHKR